MPLQIRRWIFFILLSLLTACQKSDTGSVAQQTIAVIPKGTTHVFWKSIQAGAYKAGHELGVKIDWMGPEKC